MVLTLGTNAGFVTTAPTADPEGTATGGDNRAKVLKDTSPAGAVKITEIGWWCDTATEEANFEVGLYAADGAVVPGEAGTRLFVSATNAKGTTAGWKVVSGLNWTISANTVYWIAYQLDNTATLTNTDFNSAGGPGVDTILSATTLPDPYGGGAISGPSQLTATYAVWEAGAEATGTVINIGDAWKGIVTTNVQINIGDIWKTVSGVQVNIGDVWKKVF